VLAAPPPAARAVNVLLTHLCLAFTVAATKHVPDPGDAHEPLLAWFNAAVDEHGRHVAVMVEDIGHRAWGLPASRRWAARRLVRMWEQGGAAAFGDVGVARR